MSNGGKGRLNGIRRSDALPVLGRKVVKGQQFLSVFLQAECGFRILRFIGFNEQVECLLGVCLRLGLPDRVQGLVSPSAWTDLGRQLRTFMTLCIQQRC